jgi:tryptophan synthase alpha chain
MGYVNPIFRYGVEAFCRDAAESGADGLILPDMPLEETSLIANAADRFGLALVHLIAPNTPPERVEAIDRAARGFVYAVSITGLTGSALDAQDAVVAYLERSRGLVTENPLLVGFGIRSHEDAMRLAAPVDGFIVGSALINEVERLWDDDARSMDETMAGVEAFVRTLKHGEAGEVR